MSSLLDALLIAAIVTNGLLAGLFFVFTCAIAPGFRHLDDATYVRAFRAINRAILNGWFLLVFFTAPLATLAYALLGYWRAMESPSAWAWAGAVCAALTFIITAAGNVPLNTRLDHTTAGTESADRAAREQFETRWSRWNLARTITGVGALVSLAIAAVSG